MKTYFKYICICLLAVGVSSCEEDDDLGFVEAGANTVLLDRSISIFDTNEDLTIQLSPFENEIQSVEVQGPDGSIIADAAISGNTATFNTSTLGDLTAGENIGIRLISTLTNGQVFNQRFTVIVNDALALDSAPATIRFMDTTATSLSFSTSTFAAPIDMVSLFRRTNVDTTFVNTGEVFDVENDSINLGEIDYEGLGLNVGDTIFYRFQAQSSGLSQTVDTQVVIETQDFGATTSSTLSVDPAMSGFNLRDGEFAEEGETGEIMFMGPMGFSTIEGIDFVMADVPEDMTATEFVDGLDLFAAEMLYNAGSKTTSVEEVEMGDVFIYKITRQNEDGLDVVFYGVITIGDTITLNGNNSFEFNFTEGTIIRG